jgi:hypothetical protein
VENFHKKIVDLIFLALSFSVFSAAAVIMLASIIGEMTKKH